MQTATGNGDYARVEKAIHYLDANAGRQPSLGDVAGHLGLSAFHCQRMFHRWAGVTPKDFLQVATLEYAKGLLRESRPVLEAALESGLSGPGRLHDLCLSIEAMTPGEYRRGGEGLTIQWGIHETPVGEALIATTRRGICAIRFAADESLLEREWPRARILRDHAGTAAIAREVSRRMRGEKGQPLSVLFRGTPFQVKVWQALLAIPFGAVASYSEVAGWIGHPAAHRAAASAIGANAIAALIPCHRVLRSTGAMGGYRWGTLRKRALLLMERGAPATGNS
ncbi:MAG TPA: methylated-DNA--[protein]-cysteine S-methyltransferase [Chthoniobacteraceae bacterium]|jgi:AraC family transcriptional regulator of adaptative response/methylated-DNA-[protein]-cysteine methyltransferase|nr:methylated-DNA--[protein]-cysteine S-methyltransferase [Chthoniobacteraceae bacterium]